MAKDKSINTQPMGSEAQKVLKELDGFCKGAIENLNGMRDELGIVRPDTERFGLNLDGIETWVVKLQKNYNGILNSLRKLIKIKC